MIPQPLLQTLEWLQKNDHFSAARELTLAIAKDLPAGHPQTFDFMAMNLHKSKFYPEALSFALKTLELMPDSFEAHYNVAKCYNSCGEPVLAEKHIREVLKAKPDWLDPKLDLSLYLSYQGREIEGYEILKGLKAKESDLDPKSQKILEFNLGWHYLRDRDFKKGMKALSIGRELNIWGALAHHQPKPRYQTGMNVQGKTLAVMGEGGAGDEIISVRFAKHFADLGAKVIWVSQQGLSSLFSRSPGVEKAIAVAELPGHEYDFWVPAMDSAFLLGLDIHQVFLGNYILPNAKAASLPSADPKKLKVGLRFQGNPLYEQDLYRSILFKDFEPLFALSDCQFFSLQRDSGLEELSSYLQVEDLSLLMKTWEETAALIHQLDLVITSCTSVAHLSAAMGKKTFVLTPINCYHIWAWPEDKSPWYSDVHLFRQKKFKEWHQVIPAVKERLHEEIKYWLRI